MRKNQLGWFFAFSFAITWGIGAVFILFPRQMAALCGTDTLPPTVFFAAVSAPSIVAFLLTWLDRGWTGLWKWFKSCLHFRVGLLWYAVVLLGIPLMDFLATILAAFFEHHSIQFTVHGWLLALSTFPTFWMSDPGPLGEEFGWRGFALPRMLQRMNPLVASLALGLIWGVWHLPAFFISGTAQSGMSIWSLILGTVSYSALMTWLYQKTKGSVLVSGILVHFMENATQSHVRWTAIVVSVVAAILAISTQMWKQPIEGTSPV